MLDFSSFGSCGLQAILLVSFDVSRFSLVTLLMLCYLNSCSSIIIILHLKNLGFAKTFRSWQNLGCHYLSFDQSIAHRHFVPFSQSVVNELSFVKGNCMYEPPQEVC